MASLLPLERYPGAEYFASSISVSTASTPWGWLKMGLNDASSSQPGPWALKCQFNSLMPVSTIFMVS